MDTFSLAYLSKQAVKILFAIHSFLHGLFHLLSSNINSAIQFSTDFSDLLHGPSKSSK